MKTLLLRFLLWLATPSTQRKLVVVKLRTDIDLTCASVMYFKDHASVMVHYGNGPLESFYYSADQVALAQQEVAILCEFLK